MIRFVPSAAALALGTASSVAAHEIRTGKAALSEPYAPYAYSIGDWKVSAAAGGAPFLTVQFQWAPNHAYIRYGGYMGQEPHFEGMMVWNGAHHDLDALVATDMDHGLVQERGTVAIINGAAVYDSTATYSEGVSAGGPLAGAGGAASRMRQTMRPIDANHIALSSDVRTSSGWKPAMPGSDQLLMTRANPGEREIRHDQGI